jgi:hypothetical protein
VGYWIDRTKFRYSGILYECARDTCKGGDLNSSCWELSEFNHSHATCKDDNAMQCSEGAGGPLCGACLEGYVYRGADNSCGVCETVQLESYVLVGSIMVVIIASLVYLQSGDQFEIRKHFLVQYLFSIDTGSLKVAVLTA